MPIDRRGYWSPRPRFDHGRPFATLALAPFAGVLLTMTLVFAALRPPVTHALLVDLPAPNPPNLSEVLSPVYNRLTITRAGEIRWNGMPVSERELRLILAATTTVTPQPALMFHPDPDAAYGRTLAVMEMIRQGGLIDRCFKFAELSRHRRYEQLSDPEEILPGQSAECAFHYY